jgi:hypothetical protein
VWIEAEGEFCEELTFCLRRCEKHYQALKRDDLWRSLQQMDKTQRKQALNMLDDIQKRRKPWEYRNDEGEQQLIAAAEQQETENKEND